MKTNRIIIVANGDLYDGIIDDIQRDDFVIGVDRAAYWLIKKDVVPHIAIGDFDSVTTEEMDVIKARIKDIQVFTPEKDFTDTELAIRVACKLHPQSIVIYGGSGSRLDHTIGTMQLLEMCAKSGIPAVFQDRMNEVVFSSRGRTILQKREGYRYISVIPLTHTIEISLRNVKYSAEKLTIRRGQTIGISNEFVGTEAEIIIHRGKALIIQSRD